MDHPLRTLLYELFVGPVLRFLQRALGRKVSAPRAIKSGAQAFRSCSVAGGLQKKGSA